MLKKVSSFFADLVGDGYGFVSLLAPLLSAAFTTAKALDVEALGHLREISYAWALAPITLWIFVAYLRRRAEDLNRSGAPSPDGPIRELFYHLSPSGIFEKEVYQKVGLDVQDKLSTGQMMSWGRRGNGRPLEPINMFYWSTAQFSYNFLADGHDDVVHAYKINPIGKGDNYFDIRVHRASVLRVWRR